MSKAQLRGVLKDRWMVVAGDSIGRFFFAALLRMLSDSGVLASRRDLLGCSHSRPKRSQDLDMLLLADWEWCADEHTVIFGHRDFEYNLPGNIRASFIWAPYASNLTAHLGNW